MFFSVLMFMVILWVKFVICVMICRCSYFV